MTGGRPTAIRGSAALKRSRASVLWLAAIVAGCAVPASQPAAPVAARLAPDPPPACLQAIEEVAGRATGNRVLIGPAAFSGSDELVLARALRRGADGVPLDGRLPPERPVVFKLSVGGGDQCLIRQVESAAAVPPGAGGAAAVRPAPQSAEPVVLPSCRCRAL
jgi:hypothetical protein